MPYSVVGGTWPAVIPDHHHWNLSTVTVRTRQHKHLSEGPPEANWVVVLFDSKSFCRFYNPPESRDVGFTARTHNLWLLMKRWGSLSEMEAAQIGVPIKRRIMGYSGRCCCSPTQSSAPQGPGRGRHDLRSLPGPSL